MKNAVFWDVTPCGSCKNDVSEELSASIIMVTRIGELETTLVVTSSPNLVTLMMETLSSPNPEDDILLFKMLPRTNSQTVCVQLDRLLVAGVACMSGGTNTHALGYHE
jgi:hypothetical protein